MIVVVPAGSTAHGAVTCDERDGDKVSVSGLVGGVGCICDSGVLLGRRLLRAFCFFANPARNPRLADCNNLVGDLIRFSPMKLDPAAAVEADIFVAEHGKPWRAPTWLTVHGVAVILCRSGGELDEKHMFVGL